MEPPVNLSQFASVFFRWFALIVLFAVLGGAGTYLASQSLPKEYEAEAKILIGSLSDASYDQQLGYQQLAATYAGLATITPLLDRVIAELGLPDDAAKLAGRIDVRAPLNQSLVTVVARAPSALAASQLANAVAAEVVALDTGAGATTLAAIVQTAVPPLEPSGPHVLVNSVLGVVLGLILGVCLALGVTTFRFNSRRPMVQSD
jgi:capsular polysaccharide biosynthesis protein